jgi:NAD(P)-dependent dehydrogenase (short-subunit alcohol dehydrogenase family)
MRDLDGKTAVVTGGGSGIGRSLALALAREGTRVVIGDILLDGARAVVDNIQAGGGKALAVLCDVSDRAAVRALKARANDAFGSVSLLFPNAGATSFERLTDMSEADVDWIIQSNLMGVTNCLLAFLPDMIAARDGHVVATASAAGLLPSWIPFHGPYSAAKMGIIGMMLNLRHELAEFGVGATVLCPFGVETGMRENNARYRPARFGGPRSEPVKLPGTFFETAALTFRSPDEVARLVLRAVRDDRPMVVTDASHRATFVKSYVDLVMRAFDDVEAFDRESAD